MAADGMTLEQQVVSLELAKRLKELGVKQESLFFWCNFGKDDWRGPYSDIDGTCFRYPNTPGSYDFTRKECSDYCSAFTSAELGEMLPSLDCRSYRVIPKEWICEYGRYLAVAFDTESKAQTEVDARAKMLIYLLENKLILVP